MFQKRTVWVILGILIVFNILAWAEVLELRSPDLLEVTFFDVGQGDSIFIETPKGHQILIDGGPSGVILEKLSQEMPFYDKDIDLIILTHPDHDHYFGLLKVLENYEVENIIWTGVVRETAEWQKWNELLEKEGADIRIAEAGQKIGFQPDLFLEVLFPLEKMEGKEVKNVNDTSIVARLVFEDTSFFFTGDITQKAEALLAEEYDFLESDVLKISHHGSGSSTSKEFLKSVSPGVAVIQVGENNSFGHPAPEVLAKLEEFGIEVLRTDIDGDIKIISEGEYLNLKTASEKL